MKKETNNLMNFVLKISFCLALGYLILVVIILFIKISKIESYISIDIVSKERDFLLLICNIMIVSAGITHRFFRKN